MSSGYIYVIKNTQLLAQLCDVQGILIFEFIVSLFEDDELLKGQSVLSLRFLVRPTGERKNSIEKKSTLIGNYLLSCIDI